MKRTQRLKDNLERQSSLPVGLRNDPADEEATLEFARGHPGEFRGWDELSFDEQCRIARRRIAQFPEFALLIPGHGHLDQQRILEGLDRQDPDREPWVEAVVHLEGRIIHHATEMADEFAAAGGEVEDTPPESVGAEEPDLPGPAAPADSEPETNRAEVRVLELIPDDDFFGQLALEHRKSHTHAHFDARGFEIDTRDSQPLSTLRAELANRSGHYDYIVLIGHGHSDAFRWDGSVLISTTSELLHDLVDGAIVQAFACSTAQKLGLHLADDHGCRAYIGFKDYIPIPPFREGGHGADEDYLHCVAEIDRSLAEGLSVREAHERLVAMAQQLRSEADELGSIVAGRPYELLEEFLQSPKNTPELGDPDARLF